MLFLLSWSLQRIDIKRHVWLEAEPGTGCVFVEKGIEIETFQDVWVIQSTKVEIEGIL